MCLQVDFRKPVDVGDLLTFDSRILHTRGPAHSAAASGDASAERAFSSKAGAQYQQAEVLLQPGDRPSANEDSAEAEGSNAKRRCAEVFVEVQARVNRPEEASTSVTNRFTLTYALSLYAIM